MSRFFSAIVLGVITAVGGRTIRDRILDVPVFWSADLFYVRIAVLASIVTFISLSFFSRPQIHEAMLYVDGLGAERLIHARLGDESLVIRLDASKSWPQIGDTVSLKVPDTKKHWFDAATGRRLARV